MHNLTIAAATAATMTSREIAELTGKEHKNVLADVRKMLADLGRAEADFSALAQIGGPNGSTRQIEVFILPKRETLILVSGYSIQMRAKIIDRWQALEAAALKSSFVLPNFLDPAEAARAWADQVDQKRALQLENQAKAAQLAIAAPKVEFADALLNADGTTLVRDIAKTIGARVRKLEKALKDKGVILSNGAPAAIYVEKCYFKAATYTFETKTHGTQISHTARVTGLGIEFLRRFCKRHAHILGSSH